MIVAYALGGGLGHLTRLRAALWTLGRSGEDVVVATVSNRCQDPRVVAGWHVEALADPADRPDAAGLSAAVAGLCSDPAVTDLVIDAFPCGLVGELCGLDVCSSVQVTHLARLLRWDRYLARICGRPPRIDRTWRVERLNPAQEAWLGVHGGVVCDLELVDPPSEPDPGVDVDADTTLVCHSGAVAEVDRLQRIARGFRGRIVTVSPGHLDIYPVWPYFAAAGAIVTAGGFNAIRQGEPWRDRHVAIPFERTLDDQSLRLAWKRHGHSGGGGRVHGNDASGSGQDVRVRRI